MEASSKSGCTAFQRRLRPDSGFSVPAWMVSPPATGHERKRSGSSHRLKLGLSTGFQRSGGTDLQASASRRRGAHRLLLNLLLFLPFPFNCFWVFNPPVCCLGRNQEGKIRHTMGHCWGTLRFIPEADTHAGGRRDAFKAGTVRCQRGGGRRPGCPRVRLVRARGVHWGG